MGKGIKLEYRDSAPPDQSQSSAGKTWYTIAVFLTGWGWELGEGKALNKKEAGMIAATQALENPLTGQIARVKRDFDEKAAKVRAAQQIGNGERDSQDSRAEGPTPRNRGKWKDSETEEGEVSESDDSDDSDTT